MPTDVDINTFNTIFTALKSLDEESQKRTIQSIVTLLDIQLYTSTKGSNEQTTNSQKSTSEVLFSENRVISPKEFLRDKSPLTDIERIGCLAYYLTHYREQPHFKTLDLSSLNTEATQPKMSNPTVAVDNATKAGLLVQAGKGSKQISAAGEIFVQALPDREAAKASIANMRLKRRNKKTSKIVNKIKSEIE